MTAIAFPASAPYGRPAQPRQAQPRQSLAARPRLRLTARGRAVLGSLVAVPLVAVALFLGLGSSGAVATSTATTTSFETVTVASGQSLWDIAAQVAPDADPREFAAQVVSLNQLPSSVLQPGQQLSIPAQYTD